MFEALFQDLKFGVRILLRSPAVACAVIVALALGVGANSAMFSVVDAVLLSHPPYRDPGALMIVLDKEPDGTRSRTSPANFLDWRKQSKSFEEFATWIVGAYVQTGVERPEQISGVAVTANFFHLLGVKPALGRTFLPEEDGLGGAGGARKVVVISDGFWRRRLGADPNVLGRQVNFNSIGYTIVGVMGPRFEFLWPAYEFWIPISIDRQNRDFRTLVVIGRLAKGRTRQSAQQEMAGIAQGLAEAYPKSNKGWTIEVADFQGWLIKKTFRTRLWLLFAAVGLVLLTACANVANLLLARSAARSREIAARVALGATRGRVMRQLLTESVLLSVAGGGAGLVLAWQLVRLAPTFVPPAAIPAAVPIALNATVLMFTLGISIVNGLLFGIAPALAAARSDVSAALKESARGTTGSRTRLKFRQVMVTLEVALALMLVSSALLMIDSLRALTTTELGFDPGNVLSLRIFLPAAKYDPVRALAFHREALARLHALPGVTNVSMSTSLPLLRATIGVPFDLETSPPREEAEMPDAHYITVSPDYFRTLAIAVKRGRDFADSDNENAPPVVVVSQAFAQKYFPGLDALGKRIRLDRPKFPIGFEDTIHPEIVGIVADVKGTDLAVPGDSLVYGADAQNVWSPGIYFALKSAQDPKGLTSAVRRELHAMDPGQPVSNMGLIADTLGQRSAEPRFQTRLMTAFGALALILAMVGIYSVNVYEVSQRRHEIGVKMALGASPTEVLRETIGRGMWLTGAGILAGIGGALAVASVLRSVLVGVSPTDPTTLGGVALLIAAVSAVACYLPARRATRIDPAIALRVE